MAEGRNVSDADRALVDELLTDFERKSLEEGRTISDADRALARAMAAEAKARREEGRTISDADRARMERMMRSEGGTAESTMSDDEKRNFIVDVQGIGANTAAGLSGDALKKAYEQALRDAEKDKKRGMGGAMVDELGYTRGVKLDREKRGAVKYSVGGAIKGKNFKGIF